MPRLAVLLWALLVLPVARAADWPGDSIYNLPLRMSDQSGREFALADEAGHPTLVVMFYTSCQYVCPLMIEGVKQAEHALPPAERVRLRVLLVSFDPEHDDAAALARTARGKHLDLRRWRLARTDPASVRQLAAVLGVRYRALTDGGFNHSGEINLIGADGRVLARGQAVDAGKDATFMAALHAALAADGSGGT